MIAMASGAAFVGLACILFPNVVTRWRAKHHEAAMERYRNPALRLMLRTQKPSLATTLFFGFLYSLFALILAWAIARAVAVR